MLPLRVSAHASLPRDTPRDASQALSPNLPDDEEYNEFLSRVEEVEATIKGLKEGMIDVGKLDAKEQKMKKEEAERVAAPRQEAARGGGEGRGQARGAAQVRGAQGG